MTVSGFTSTGSKRPDALYGATVNGVPLRMVSSAGCLVQASDGREYLDFIMGLGAVALGYGHPAVNHAAKDAIERGAIGPLAPVDEEALASDLSDVMPWLEEVRFLKTGAEAAAAAVRIARVATGRDLVLGCGYHGWLDWCSSSRGVPAGTMALYADLPFNDAERTRERIRKAGDRLACVIVEPVIDGAPDIEWLDVLRTETAQVGAILVFDEIKTAFRVALGGATERWGVQSDLTVLGKGLANGFPLAAVGGSAAVMRHVGDTWISSTMATEFVSLAAARATLAVMQSEDVPAQLASRGSRLFDGLMEIGRVKGIPEMCYLDIPDAATSAQFAIGCASRGLLFKRSAYNFVSLAHDADLIDRALGIIADVVAGMGSASC